MFTDKITLALAEAAKKCMETEAAEPKSEKEKELAAMGHPKDKITKKDILIGRGILKKEENEQIEEEEGKLGYVAFGHNGQRHELYANSSYEAKQKAVKHFNPPKSKQHLVSVHLAQKDGKDVVHTATESVQEGALDDLRDRQAAEREKRKDSYDYSKEKEVKKPNVIIHKAKPSGEEVKEETELDESKAHIEQHLADKDINSKVVGKTVKVHSSDVASATKHVKMAGYDDHKVVGGLNEELVSEKYNLPKHDSGKVDARYSIGREHTGSGDKGGSHVVRFADKFVSNHGSKEEAEKAAALHATKRQKSLGEEKMSDEDMADREKYVKGMKKNLKGFKARYGDKAKEVMYATATKMTKEEFSIEDFTVEQIEEFMQTEDYEQLDELSKKTLGDYVKKAGKQATRLEVGFEKNRDKGVYRWNDTLKAGKREAGIAKAVDKLTKEEATNDEFKDELEDNKAKAAGTKKQADVAKASVQAVKQESFSEKVSTILNEGYKNVK